MLPVARESEAKRNVADAFSLAALVAKGVASPLTPTEYEF
jgi:hypothetical protein